MQKSKYKVGHKTTPKGLKLLTGYGIIVGVSPLTQDFIEFLNKSSTSIGDGCLYSVITDFGNKVNLTLEELEQHHTLSDEIYCVRKHFQTQMYLLRKNIKRYVG